MPKIKTLTRAEEERLKIGYYCKRRGLTKANLAKKIGMPAPTFYAKQRTLNFTVWQLLRIYDVLQIPQEERMRL